MRCQEAIYQNNLITLCKYLFKHKVDVRCDSRHELPELTSSHDLVGPSTGGEDTLIIPLTAMSFIYNFHTLSHTFDYNLHSF